MLNYFKSVKERFARWFIYGSRRNSESYINYLRKKGILVGSGTVFFDPASTTIDIQNPSMLKIGKNVRITKGVIILTHDYSWSVLAGVYGECIGNIAPVEIGNNIFIGMNAIITNGVKINDNVIIGAGSVVTKDCEANSVYAGNPAKKIMSLEEYYSKRKRSCKKEVLRIAEIIRNEEKKIEESQALREYCFLFKNLYYQYGNQLMNETGYYTKCREYYDLHGIEYLNLDEFINEQSSINSNAKN